MRILFSKKSLFFVLFSSLFFFSCTTSSDLPSDIEDVAEEETPEWSEESLAFEDGGEVTSMIQMPAEMINFDFDKNEIKEEFKSTLRELASFLKENPGTNLAIEGHCDALGTIEYNLALGQRRANAVKTYLMALGVASKRLSTISFGKEQLMDNSGTQAGNYKNRRAMFSPSGTSKLSF